MGKVLALLGAGVFAAFAANLILAWWTMLLLGAVHLNVFAWVPALGFWQTVWVVLLLGALGGVFNYTVAYNVASKRARR